MDSEAKGCQFNGGNNSNPETKEGHLWKMFASYFFTWKKRHEPVEYWSKKKKQKKLNFVCERYFCENKAMCMYIGVKDLF